MNTTVLKAGIRKKPAFFSSSGVWFGFCYTCWLVNKNIFTAIIHIKP